MAFYLPEASYPVANKETHYRSRIYWAKLREHELQHRDLAIAEAVEFETLAKTVEPFSSKEGLANSLSNLKSALWVKYRR